MTDVWLVVLVVGLGTMMIKAVGPVLFGGRPLPDRLRHVVGLLAPALLAALVATTTFGEGQGLVADARLIGVASAAVALALRVPTLAVVLIAAFAAAVARATGIA